MFLLHPLSASMAVNRVIVRLNCELNLNRVPALIVVIFYLLMKINTTRWNKMSWVRHLSVDTYRDICPSTNSEVYHVDSDTRLYTHFDNCKLPSMSFFSLKLVQYFHQWVWSWDYESFKNSPLTTASDELSLH